MLKKAYLVAPTELIQNKIDLISYITDSEKLEDLFETWKIKLLGQRIKEIKFTQFIDYSDNHNKKLYENRVFLQVNSGICELFGFR